MIQLENAVARYEKIILGKLYQEKVKCWLAGGAIRDYFMGIAINTDYDIFFPDESNYNKAKIFFTDRDAKIIWESDNGMKVKYKGKTYDLIKKFFPDPQATIEAFDFTVSMFAVDAEKVYFGETTFIDLAKRQLMINALPHPISTLSRAFRYYKKGFQMCSGEMRKLVEAIQQTAPPKTEEGESPENTSSGGAIFFAGID